LRGGGFPARRPDRQQAHPGAKYGWQEFLAGLEKIPARIERSMRRDHKPGAAYRVAQLLTNRAPPQSNFHADFTPLKPANPV